MLSGTQLSDQLARTSQLMHAPSYNQLHQMQLQPMKSNNLTKLPPISLQQYRWLGDKKILSHWLRQFRADFSKHPEGRAVHFLKSCLRDEHKKGLSINIL